MKLKQKYITITLLSFFSLLSQFLNAQSDSLIKNSLYFQKKYLGVIPQKGRLEFILEQFLQNGVVTDTIFAKTDTSLFYFRGYSKILSPFSIDVDRIEYQVRQSKVYGHDRKSVIDTSLSIQVIGILHHSDNLEDNILSEFKKIRKDLSANHKIIRHSKSRKKENNAYETISFFPYPLNSETLYSLIIVSYGKHYQKRGEDSIAITFVYKSGI